MLTAKEFPILEYDSNPRAKLEPYHKVDETVDVPERCVITFFGDVIEALRVAGRLRQLSTFFCATVALPIYETEYKGERIGLIQGFLGAPGSAAQLEELIAMGFKKFIVCGAAGVLRKDIQVGHLVLPASAVRDEGTSYHYLPPTREVKCCAHALSVMRSYLTEQNIPFIEAKTWTTDAFYRETEEKIALRASEGCVTVEMEAAAFFAVSAFRKVTLGQVLFGGDDLSSVEWDARSWVSREEIRRNLVDVAFEMSLRL